MRSKGEKRETARKSVTAVGGGSPIAKVVERLNARLGKSDASAVVRFLQRLSRMKALGMRRTQITRVVGVSYSAIHGFMSGRIAPSPERLKEYHQKLDAWVAEARKV